VRYTGLFISAILSLSTLTSCAIQKKAKAEDPSGTYKNGLPVVVNPKIQCSSCKEEDAKNTGKLPAKQGELYLTQLRDKNSRVVWHLYNGSNYIGSASMLYKSTRTTVIEWDLYKGNTVKLSVINVKDISISGKGSKSFAVNRPKVWFDF
jgi:hypothetical protein